MKKKYNKPLTTATVVRSEMGFCGSIMNAPSKVKAERHETGFDSKDAGADGTTDGFEITTDWH